VAASKSHWAIHALAVATFLAPATLLEAESTGAYVDDAAITTNVQSDILADDALKAATEIKVVIDHHIVSLMGTVKSSAEPAEAERVAMAIKGVASFKNDIVVRSY